MEIVKPYDLYDLINNPIQYNRDAGLLTANQLLKVRDGNIPRELNCQGLIQLGLYLAIGLVTGNQEMLSKESFLKGEYIIPPGLPTNKFRQKLIKIPNTTGCILYAQSRNGSSEDKLMQEWTGKWKEEILRNLHMGLVISSSDEAHECMFSPKEWDKLKLEPKKICVFHTTNNPRVEVGRNSRSGLTSFDEFCDAYFPVALKM